LRQDGVQLGKDIWMEWDSLTAFVDDNDVWVYCDFNACASSGWDARGFALLRLFISFCMFGVLAKLGRFGIAELITRHWKSAFEFILRCVLLCFLRLTCNLLASL
jgi:hypothetical protein